MMFQQNSGANATCFQATEPDEGSAFVLWTRRLTIVVTLLLFSALSVARPAVIAAVIDEASETEIRKTTERFLKVLAANPRPGTAFEKVYSYHIDRGAVVEFQEALRTAAGLPDDLKPSDPVTPTISTSEGNLAIALPSSLDESRACLLYGLIALRHSEAAAAIVALERATELRPEDSLSHWSLARAYSLKNQTEDAIQSLKRAIDCQPAKVDLLEIYTELGRTLQKTQRLEDALNVWKSLEAEFPRDLRVKEQIAAALREDGRWEEAFERFQSLAKITTNDDQRIQANLSASDLLVQLGRSQDAIRLLEKQLEGLDPDSWLFGETRRRIESIFRDRDDLAGLASYYEAWVKAHPEDIDAMARLARTLSLQNKTAEASNWYRKAIALAPSNVSLRESLIEQLVRDNQLPDAIAQYEEMSKFDDGNQDHIEKWGLLIFNQKDVPLADRQVRAAEVWERLLTNRPDDPVTMARLAGLLRRAELSDRAIAMYRSAIEKAPNDPQYREYLGEYLHQLQRVDEAVTEWKLMADGDRRNKANLIRLAEVLNRFDQLELGVAAMRDACSMDPTPLERVQFAEMLRNRSGIRENSPALNVGRTERSEFRQDAIDAPDAGTRDARSGLHEEFTEALQQLNIAEQSAETPDERQQILKERIQCLVAAGQLEQQIDLLAKELASTTTGADPVVMAERWRTLALYQDAAENTNEATAAAMKVVELQPDSIPGWTLLATLYERTGRLGDAADAMKKLASLDRRGISEYLRKTARLQVRLGQFDAALATGRDVIKATPGNPEAYQFFADLAFEVGQPKIAVDSLRQAVRVNPGDEASLKALAKTLADEFQTPEAIELYWRAFEKAPDLESQTQIVVALSNLYLRSNQFPKLIERLELRSRELNLPTEMTRCIATAYREAGDFRTARMTLERLSSGTAEQAVLRELHFLASREQNDAVADDLARRILSQSDIENPEFDTDRLLSPETIDKAETPDSILRLLRQPVTKKNLDEQISLCRQYLKTRPDDWAVLNAMAILLHRTGHAAESVELAMAVLRMPADPKEHGSMGGLLSLQLQVTPDALSTHADLLTIEFGVDQRQFTAAWCQCLDLVLLESEPVRPELVAELLSKSNMDRFDDVPCWFMAKYVPGNSPVVESLLTQLSRLTVDDGWDQSRCLTYRLLEATLRLRVGKSNAKDLKMSRDAVVRQLPQLILETPSHFQRLPLSDCLWHMFKDAQESSRELARQINRTIDGVKLPESQAAVAAVALALKDDELLRKSVASLTPTSLDNRSSPFCDMLRIIVDRSGFMNAPNLIMPSGNLKLITTLATIACRHESLSSTVEQSLYQTVDQRFNTVGNKDWESHLFPQKSFAEHLLMIMEWDDDHGEAMTDQWAAESMADPDSLFQARVHLLLSDRELGDPQLHLIRAAELMPSVPGLRFDVAREAADAKLWPEAIELLDSLSLTETSAQIEVESRILEWSLAAGNKERARLAAKRLFGLPIDQSQQLQLASRLSQLGLEEELASLNARLGRGAETRQSVLGRKLQTYLAQGNEQLAGEVAWELLKLASGGTLFSGTRPNDDRDDGGERLQAIKALGKLKRLQPLIDRYEAMLEASPDSVDLLEILCEFHEAAEQFPQLAEKRDRIALLSKKAPPSLKAKAVALENSGDVSGACDIYLQILKDDPEAFAEEMETYFQAFERAKRQADFLTAVLSLDEYLWSGNAALLINVTVELARAKSHDDVVKKSVEAMLANEETRRLAIGGFLARPDVIAEDQLLPAIQEELSSDSAFESYASTNEIFLILQGIKQESSLKSLRDFVGRTERSEFRQGDVDDDASRRSPIAGTRDARSGLLLVFFNARLGDRAEVEKQLAAICRPNDDAEQADSEIRLMLFAMNARLKDLGSEWLNSRRIILEWMLNQPMTPDDFDSLADSLTASDDAVMEELRAVYELLGDSAKSRAIMNRRIQALIANTDVSGEGSSESIRQLLQAGEKIQASGFPIEGTQLLLNVTAHDIDVFTKDLDPDKAIAFKSRFNASQRWARQQITPEHLIVWFEMWVDQTADEAPRPDVDLLLEISGVTNPRFHDEEQLRRTRLDSVLLTTLSKQVFDSAPYSERTIAAIRKLTQQQNPDLRLLGVALSLATKLELKAESENIIDRLSLLIVEANDVQRDAESFRQRENARVATEHESRSSRAKQIPEILRSEADIACVFLARMLLNDSKDSGLVEQLLNRSCAAARRSPSRLVQIALLQEIADVARRTRFNELTSVMESEAAVAIQDHVQEITHGTDGSFDLAHEIRTRLLKQP